MKIKCKIKTNSKEERIEKVEENEYDYKIYTKASPTDGKANKSILKHLAKYFNTSPSNVRIISGSKQRYKLIEIENEI